MKFSAIVLLCLVCAAPLSARPDDIGQRPSSHYTKLNNCAVTSDGEAEGEDWIAYRCEGLGNVPIWLTYSDSARSYLGFGHRENLSGPFALSSRDKTWPVEWRGVDLAGSFKPFAAIVRMVRPEGGAPTDGQALLFVFRLRADGTSCMMASDLATNEMAREEADKAREKFQCLFEPNVSDRS